jgi:hypothetical protein
VGKYLKEASIAFAMVALLPVVLIVMVALIPWVIFAIFWGK